VATIALVLVAAAAAGPVVHATEVVLQVVLITVASIAGVAVLGLVAVVAVRVYRWRSARATAVGAGPLPQRVTATVLAPPRRAIEAPEHHRARPQPAEQESAQVRRLP
jgi:hypothetical protein